MWSVNWEELDQLSEAMKAYQGDVETTINDVLHNEAGGLIKESVHKLIPASGRKSWKGKARPASESDSLRNVNENLAVTITTKKRYQYLYFPDDGTSTRRHIGNQRFFEKGGEAVKDDVIGRCLNRLTENFE